MAVTMLLNEVSLCDYQITTFVTGGAWKENCYLVRHVDTCELALIDPGEDDGRIIEAVQNRGNMLRYILLTHAHHDHVGGVASLARKFGIPCHVHPNDVRLLHHAPMYAWRFAQKRIEAPKPYIAHSDQADLQLGKRLLSVIHTPGHTSGSVCYVIGGAVFTGDTLLFQHVGRVGLPGADAQLMKESISCLICQLPPETVILPGHGRSWTMGEAQQWWQSVAIDAVPQYSEPLA